jgi:hypothetical protein
VAKESGLGWTSMSVDDSGGTLQDIRNDCTNLEFATPRAVQDVTGLDVHSMERLLLLADMSLTLNGVFNDDANKSHAVFRTVPSTSAHREILLVVSGQRLGTTPQVTMLATDYALTRAASGELTWSVPMVLSNGVLPTWDTA